MIFLSDMQDNKLRKDKIMNQFFIILKFELQHYFKNKIFVGITIFLVLAIGIVMFFPRISGLFERGSESVGEEDKKVMLVTADTEEEAEVLGQVFRRPLRIMMFRRRRRAWT